MLTPWSLSPNCGQDGLVGLVSKHKKVKTGNGTTQPGTDFFFSLISGR